MALVDQVTERHRRDRPTQRQPRADEAEHLADLLAVGREIKWALNDSPQAQHVGEAQAYEARAADTEEFTTAESVARGAGLSWDGDHGWVLEESGSYLRDL